MIQTFGNHLARDLVNPRKVNEILMGKRGISAFAAIDLSEVLRTTPEYWLNLQHTWDLAQAYRDRKAS